MFQSLLGAAGFLQRLRQREFVSVRLRRQTHGLVQHINRRIERPALHRDHAQQVQNVGLFGIHLQQTAVNRLRFVQPPLFVQPRRVLQQIVQRHKYLLRNSKEKLTYSLRESMNKC